MFVHGSVFVHQKEQSMYRKLALTAVLTVALAITGYAQKPDFSGAWTPDTSAATSTATTTGGGGGGGGRGGGMGGPITVKHTGDSLVIERTAGENKITSTYKLDGTESVNKMMGRGGAEVETKSTAKWDGSKLTIVTKQTAPDGSVRESSQSWWLEGGNLVVESTRTGREGAPVTAKTVYKKTT
jgi:hypothetical protein